MGEIQAKNPDFSNGPPDLREIQLALAHFEAGRFNDAQSLCRQVLSRSSRNPEALHLLGILTAQAGDTVGGIKLIARCVETRPDWAEAHSNLASALRTAGCLDESISASQRALELMPANAPAHYNLGAAFYEKGMIDHAITSYRRAMKLNPQYVEAMNDLGVCLAFQGEIESAIALYLDAVHLRPEFSEAHNNLANALKHIGRLDEAIASYGLALKHNPRFAQARNNLGVALLDRGRFDESLASFQAALSIDPNYVEALNNLGNLLVERGQLDDAVRILRRAISLKPNLAEAHNNLGNALKSGGQLDQAIQAYGQAVQLQPGNSRFHSNLVYAGLFHPDVDEPENRRRLADWNARHAKRIVPAAHHKNAALPDRRLRIGYISPDFRDHVIGRNILPLFRDHDRTRFEIFCYARLNRRDEFTRRFQACTDHWRDITGMSDHLAAQLISDDRIDILIDLAMHLSDNVLPILAQKPAPIQITFAAYPGSTGLDAVDYRISDPHLHISGDYAERTICLPETFWCYDPSAAGEQVFPVSPLPAQTNGHITFGCLCDFCKINPKILALWASVLKLVANSRLLMLAPAGESRLRVLANFRSLGINSERLIFIARQSRLDYLRTYSLIDICLDTLPYNGHTTSLDALWMGVPVVTRIGRTIVGRAGLSQMTNLGLPELIARTDEQFMDIAANLVSDLPKLANLRAKLRDRLERSPLMDAGRFARNIEHAYRTVWREWCREQVSSQPLDRVEVQVSVAARGNNVKAA